MSSNTISTSTTITSTDFDYLVKIVVVGESGVGKSSLLKRFSDDEFVASYISTIGVDFAIRSLTIDDKKVKLQIWDTAGQERFHNITTSYYRGAHGILLCIDVTDADSVRSIPRWMREIELHAAEGTPILLVANKCDLPTPSPSSTTSGSSSSSSSSLSLSSNSYSSSMSSTRAIARPRVIDSAGLATIGRDLGIAVIETSARDSNNVDLAFTMIARSAIDITNQRFGIGSAPAAGTGKGSNKDKLIDGTNIDLGDAPTTTLRCCVIL